MAADYAVLSTIYTTVGMARFAEGMTPRLIDYAQRNDWLGRRVLDLGCGTGASLEWLIRHNYITVGVDQSPEMLDQCRTHLEANQLNHDLRQRDVRELGVDIGGMDMVLAIDLFNELSNLRDLETLFKSIHAILNDHKLLIFDVHTIQGLSYQASLGDQIMYDNPNLMVITSNQFDHDRQSHERRYIIFHRADDAWQRYEGFRVLRGYPAQAIASLLQRCGFAINAVVTPDFEVFEPGVTRADRIIFLAEKQ